MKTTVGEIKKLIREAADDGFKNAWAAFDDLINDPEFGNDLASQEEQDQEYNRVVASLGLPESDASLLEKLKDYVVSAAGDTYYAEYASNAPGSRASHRSDAMKWSRLAKNVLRQVYGRTPRGAEERSELESFIASLPQPPGDDVYAPDVQGLAGTKRPLWYTDAAKEMAKNVVKRFGLSPSVARDAVTAYLQMNDPGAIEHTRKYYGEEMDSIAMKLRSLKRRQR